MRLGMIGLGKMGLHLCQNLLSKKHQVVGYDIDQKVLNEAAKIGVLPKERIEDVVLELAKPRILWLMLPAGEVTSQTVERLAHLLEPGDIIIDGGNANYLDSIQRAEVLAKKKIHFMDAGTSGGITGAQNGACIMIGGAKPIYQYLEPLLSDLAIVEGLLYTGRSGSGHFLKMVHNGIEYGMMQAIGEGFQVLEASDFNYDYQAVAHLWNYGSVIRGWLMELTENAFKKNAKLNDILGVVDASGEAEWMVQTAIAQHVSTPVIALSLMIRFMSQDQEQFSNRVVAALRNEFGGHAVVKK